MHAPALGAWPMDTQHMYVWMTGHADFAHSVNCGAVSHCLEGRMQQAELVAAAHHDVISA